MIVKGTKDSIVYQKLKKIGQVFLGTASNEINDIVKYLEELTEKLKIGRLHFYGVNYKDFPAIIEHSLSSSSMKGNPVLLGSDQIKRILEEAF